HQMDFDFIKKTKKDFINNNKQNHYKHGASFISLYEFAYAIKKLDTNDFFVETEIWNLLEKVNHYLKDTPTTILPEI
ncbi:sucrose phosphorylase, partial [Lactobacillus acidophilus]